MGYCRKGVTIVKQKTSFKVSDSIFKGKFKSSKKLVLEEFLQGEEASYFLIMGKNHFKFFGSAQDHKRLKEGDKGPNTGEWALILLPVINRTIEKNNEKIVNPTLFALKEKNIIQDLYVGLMIK